MNRRGFLIRAGVVASALGAGWWLKEHVLWRAPDLTFSAGDRTPWLDFAHRIISPTVPVSVAGHDTRVLIDSGAQFSVIDRAFYQSIRADLGPDPLFNIPLIAYGVGGQPQMGQGLRLDLNLEGLTVGGLRCALLDLGPLATEEGLGTPIILGQDALEWLGLEVNLVARQLRLMSRDAVAPDARWSRAAVRRKGTALITPVEVEGHALEAVVDTGASSFLSLSKPAAEAAGLLDGRPLDSGESLVLGGQIRAEIATVSELKALGQSYEQIAVPIYDAVGVPGLPTALLGMEAFRGQSVLLDIGGSALYRSATSDIRVET